MRCGPGLFVQVTLILRPIRMRSSCRRRRCRRRRPGSSCSSSSRSHRRSPAGHGRAAAGRGDGHRAGAAAGEEVVTDGQLRLTPGRAVATGTPGRTGGGEPIGRGRAAQWRRRRARRRWTPRRESGESVMNFAEPFIRRPVATTLLVLTILIFGIMGYRLLPVSDLPTDRLPDHPGQREPARRQPRHDGVVGRDAAREAVLDDRRRHLDQLEQRPGQHQHHAAVRSEPQHRLRRAGRAVDDRARRRGRCRRACRRRRRTRRSTRPTRRSCS